MFKSRKLCLFFLSALVAFAPLATDLYLPSVTTIQGVFHVSAHKTSLIMSVYLLSYAFFQLIWGPLSDRFGRKPAILVGLCLFSIASLLCATTHSIDLLLLYRALQGVAACSGLVVTLAIANDLWGGGEDKTRNLSIIWGVMLVAPMIAPTIGGELLRYFNWRFPFYALGFFTAILFVIAWYMPETHAKENRLSLSLRAVLGAYRKQIGDRSFFISSLLASFNFSILLAFIMTSPQIYMSYFGVSPLCYGLFFGFNALGLLIGNNTSTLLLKRFPNKLIQTASLGQVIGVIFLLLDLLFYSNSVWGFAFIAFVISLFCGLLLPIYLSQALRHVCEYNGIASALLGFFRFSIASLIGYVAGNLVCRGVIFLGVVMGILCFLICLLNRLYRVSSCR